MTNSQHRKLYLSNKRRQLQTFETFETKTRPFKVDQLWSKQRKNSLKLHPSYAGRYFILVRRLLFITAVTVASEGLETELIDMRFQGKTKS